MEHDGAAVGHEGLTRHVAAGVGEQEGDDRRDVVLGVTVAGDRLAGEGGGE